MEKEKLCPECKNPLSECDCRDNDDFEEDDLEESSEDY